MSSLFAKTLAKYLPSSEARKKYKRQCLKTKNILEQNDSIQIGCKIQKLYDFYTSKNLVQVNIFIGNKTSKPIDRYSIDFKGTPNLSVFIEQKPQKYIKQNTQAKQRIVIEWNPEQNSNAAGNVLLTMSFSSTVLTLKDTVIPLSLWSFYNFPSDPEQIIRASLNLQSITEIFRQKYELMEEQCFELNTGLFRKGFNMKDMEKLLQKLTKISSKPIPTHSADQLTACFAGVFTVKTLLEQIGIVVEIDATQTQPVMKVTLAGNQYTYFESVFQNVRFLFQK